MPLSRFADQMIGADLNKGLAKSQSYAANTYHVAPLASGSGAGAPILGLVAGAWASDGILDGAGKFLQLVVDITNIGGAGTVTVSILGVDAISGKTYVILASTALGAVATTVLRVGPALTAAANLVANDFMPLQWGVQVVVGVNAVIFSLGASQMP